MLAANETVARHLAFADFPGMYRVHEKPDEEKIAGLAEFVAALGLRLPKFKALKPRDLQNLLRTAAGRPEEKLIGKVLLRSLKQAEYRSENIGHFGLASSCYTHFTSPIRRYPDLIVHRLLKEESKRRLSSRRREQLRGYLTETARRASQRERLADAAERAVGDLKKAQYMGEHVGETFAGYISGVTAHGLFVELENGAEGILPVSALTDDYYVFAEREWRLVGRSTGRVYRLGDPLEVEVTRADLSARTVDFVLPGNKPSDPYDRARKKAPSKRKPAPEGKKLGAVKRKKEGKKHGVR
jgi:ribonuclease R